MRVGTVGYATNQGLGILIKSFVDNGIVDDILIVLHDGRDNHVEWYPPGSPTVPLRGFDVETARNFIDTTGVDVMLFFETPFSWHLLDHCRSRGVRTVIMPMYECSLRDQPAQPDWYICPSLLDQQYFPERSTFIPVPVDVPWRLRTRAEHFVHNAGNLGLNGRNGTEELLLAMRYAVSPIKLTVRSQTNKINRVIPPSAREDKRVSIAIGDVPYESLWDDGDVFIFPEKFNGLSLPLQEAWAAGMLVMGCNRFPMSTWLPNRPLIPISGTRRTCIHPKYLQFEEAIVEPKTIAQYIDAWYGKDISSYSVIGSAWASKNTWERLKPRYEEVLANTGGRYS